jgi:Mitochondrial ribosomal protein L37
MQGVIIKRQISSSTRSLLALKAGTPIPGLNFLKGKDPVVALERSAYPEWIDDLAKPQAGLPPFSTLRKMEFEDANIMEVRRFMKLERRITIKTYNSEKNAE